MAIEYVRVSFIGRSKGKNACEVAAYNANCKIKDLRTNHSFNYSRHSTNIYHQVLLPEHVDLKFKDIALLMNEVELREKRKDSCLLKEYLLALPDNYEISLKHKIILIRRFIEKLELIQNNVAVVIDIHQPDGDGHNWYGKLLVTARRFSSCGKYLLEKALDLERPIRKNKGKAFIPSDVRFILPSKLWRIVQSDYFKELGLALRVDKLTAIPQEHIGLRKYGIIAEERRKAINAIQHCGSNNGN